MKINKMYKVTFYSEDEFAEDSIYVFGHSITDAVVQAELQQLDERKILAIKEMDVSNSGKVIQQSVTA